MILNLADNIDRTKAETYFSKLLEDGSKIELKKIPKKRTLKQNRYVHALFTLAGSNFGYSSEEMKITVKRILGYTYVKGGNEYFVSTAGMNTKEKTVFIDKFRNWSAHEGYYLPSADEMGQNWEYFAKEIERTEVAENRYTY